MEYKVEDSADFTLPPIKGIDGYLDYLRQWGHEHGTERLMAVRPDGGILFNVVGNEEEVQEPEPYRTTGCPGHWLLHNHPQNPCSISIPDIFAADRLGAEGILAVCDDGSVTWTHGIAWENANPVIRAIPQFALASFQDVGRFVQRQIDRAVGDTLHERWSDTDERYIIQSDLICELAVRKGMLLDYYRNSGPEQERILSAYKARMTERLLPTSQNPLIAPRTF